MYIDSLAMPWMRILVPPPTTPRASSARYVRTYHPFRDSLDQVAARSAASGERSGFEPYVIQKGDTLSGIVRGQLRAQGLNPKARVIYEMVQKVARANGLADPDRIYPGQQLDLSALDPRPAVPPAQAEATPLAPPPMTTLPGPPPSVAPSALPEGPSRPGVMASPLPQFASLMAPPTEPEPEEPSQGGPVESAPPSVRKALEFEDAVSSPPPAPRPSVDLTELVRDILTPKTLEDLRASSPWRKTLDGPAQLTSEYGMRKDPFTGRPAFHDGIDLSARHGTTVRPYRSGSVTYSGWKSGYGRVVVVKHEDGLESVYGHNAKNLVQEGDHVDEHTAIAQVGSTGRSTGPHLHFEIRRQGRAVNPVPYLTQDSVRFAHR